MGNASRIVLVGGMSLVVGIYGVSLKGVQTANMGASLMPVKRVQYEGKEAAAVRSAMNDWETKVRLYGPQTGLTGGPASCLGGGTFTYEFKNGTANYADLSLSMTSYQDFLPRVVTASVMKKGSTGELSQGPRTLRRGVWQVTKYYVQRGW